MVDRLTTQLVKVEWLQWVRSFAIEGASRGVRFNTITPGFIATDMTDKLSDDVKSSLSQKFHWEIGEQKR